MKRLLLIIVLFVCLPVIAQAQVSSKAVGEDGSKKGSTVFLLTTAVRPASGGLGYEGANPAGQGRARHYLTNLFYLEGGAQIAQDTKIETGDGYSFGGQVAMGLAFDHLSQLEIEAGVKLVELRTSEYRKADIAPFIKGRIHIGEGVFLEGAFASADRIGYITEPLSEALGLPINLNKSNSFQLGLIHRIPVTEGFGILSHAKLFLTRFRTGTGDAVAAGSVDVGGGVYFILR